MACILSIAFSNSDQLSTMTAVELPNLRPELMREIRHYMSYGLRLSLLAFLP
jgi:hypothetical protein